MALAFLDLWFYDDYALERATVVAPLLKIHVDMIMTN